MVQLSVVERQKISTAFKSGAGITSLAKQYGVTRTTIKRWVLEGDKRKPNWQGAPGRGRRCSTTAAQRKAIKQMAARGASLRRVARHPIGLGLSRTTLGRIVKGGRAPLQWRVVCRGRSLSDRNQNLRLKWCQDNLDSLDPSTCVFVDSKLLHVSKDTARHMRYCWQNPQKQHIHPQQSNPVCHHFYGAIGLGRKSSLVFVPPTAGRFPKGTTFTSKAFIRAIKQLHKEVKGWLPPGTSYTLILDHARQHFSKETKAAMEHEGIPVLESFPAQSWDLNVIENAWGIMDDKLSGRRPRTPKGYLKVIKDAWDKVPVHSIKKLVEHFPCRMEQCIQNEGAWPA